MQIETAQIAGGGGLVAIGIMPLVHAFRNDERKPDTLTTTLCILGGLILLVAGIQLFVASDVAKSPL